MTEKDEEGKERGQRIRDGKVGAHLGFRVVHIPWGGSHITQYAGSYDVPTLWSTSVTVQEVQKVQKVQIRSPAYYKDSRRTVESLKR